MDQENEHLCRKCGVNLIDTSESQHSILCTTCRKEQIAYPIPKILLGVMATIMGIVVILCIITLPSSIKDYRAYLDDYNSLLASNYNTLYGEDKVTLDISEAIDVMETAMEKGQYSYAVEVFNNYLAGKSASDGQIRIIDKHLAKLEAYTNTSVKYEEIYNSLDQSLSTEEMSDVFNTEFNKLLGNSDYDKATIYYILGLMATDDDKAKEYYTLSIAEDENYLDSKVQIANILRRNGEFAAAKDMYNTVLEKHKTDSGALRGLAILSMLEGNNEEAVRLAKAAYESDTLGEYVYETLIIALKQNGQSEESQKYIDEYKEYGNELEEETISLLENSITLEEYYLK